MTKTKFMALVCVCLAFAPAIVYGDEWDKKTIFTFNAPVEVSGQVLLPGSYVFKLLDSTSNRNIVQVYNEDQDHLIGTFLTISDYRVTPPAKPLITFEERPAGSPEAIKSWFYPGDNYGNEFVYPKERAVQLAAASQQNVPSMPQSMASDTTSAVQNQNSQQVSDMKQTDIKAQKPSGEEVELSEVFLVVAPVTTQPPPPAEKTLIALVNDAPAGNPAGNPARIPATGSPIPAFLLAGLVSLAAGLALRIKKARAS